MYIYFSTIKRFIVLIKLNGVFIDAAVYFSKMSLNYHTMSVSVIHVRLACFHRTFQALKNFICSAILEFVQFIIPELVMLLIYYLKWKIQF